MTTAHARTPKVPKCDEGYRWVPVGWYLLYKDEQRYPGGWGLTNSWGWKCLTPHAYRRRIVPSAKKRKGGSK